MENRQWTLDAQNISLELAHRMIEAAKEKAAEIGIPFSIAIVDNGGHLKAFAAMDGVGLLTIEIAQNKAYTAAVSRRPTHEWYERIQNEPALLHGIVHTSRLVIFGGGYPIRINGHVVGGIGVSGGSVSQDMQVAQAAIEFASNLTKK
jgi:uncharacterized protein GlcG (DUF336 family)